MARYNYIFRHDDPRRRRGSKTQRRRASTQPRRAGSNVRPVYVPETGETYPSIAAAARELGVDSGNISKVLSGKRKTAGGFHFIRGERPETWSGSGGRGAWEMPEATGEGYGGGISGAGSEDFEDLDVEIEEAPSIDPSETLRDQIKQQIDEINKLIEEARAKGREGFLDDLNDLHDFASTILGETGDNLIDDQSDVLDDMDLEELEQLRKALGEKLAKARSDVEQADDRIKGYADAFGTSSHEMEQYEHLIPEINRTLERARQHGEGSNLFYAIKDAISRGVDPDDLQELLDMCNRFFDNPGAGDSIRSILSEWESSVYGGDSWEDLEDDNIW